jgi:hypothetical protein
MSRMSLIWRFILSASLACIFGFATIKPTLAVTKEWRGVRSPHFLILSHTGNATARALTAQLEEFRAALSHLLAKDFLDSDTPTIVFIFADDDEYTPFKPLHEGEIDRQIAGYFRSAPDTNYITLAARTSEAETASVLFHEYIHLLVKNRYERAPVWLRRFSGVLQRVLRSPGTGKFVWARRFQAGFNTCARTNSCRLKRF